MKSFKKSIILTACLLLVVTTAQAAFAQTTSILVRHLTNGQPNIPVKCLTTGEIKYTSESDVISGSSLTPKGTVKFSNGITDMTKYRAYYGGFWHECSPCDGPAPAAGHFHCELPYSTLKVQFMYGGNYAIGVPVRVFDYDGYSLMDEDVFTDSHGIATLCPPSDIQYEGFMVGYRKYHYYSSGFSGTYYPVTDEYGNLLFGQFGVTEANLSYNLPGDSMVLQLNPANGATVAVFNSNPTKTFTWASVPNASYYTLLLQKTGQTVTTHQAYSTSYTASLSPGTWVWQVEAHFASSNYSVLSPVREFKVITTISSTTLSQNSGDQVSQTEKSQAESSSYEPPYEIFDADSYYNDCDAFDED